MRFHEHGFHKRIGAGWVLYAGLFVVLMMGGFAGRAEAFTCATATTCTVVTSYKEPLVSANGATIDDLKQTTVILTVGGVAHAPIVTPASAATGGGSVTKSVTVTAPNCTVTTVAVVARAEDTFSAIGPDATASLDINRGKEAGCEPGPVTNFTIN